MVTSKRGYQPKRRNTGLRERKKLLIISTEGKNKTETQYFKQLINQTRRVIVARGNDTDPIQIVEHLKEEMKDSDFNPDLGDLAFAFVDHDLKPEKDATIASAEVLLGNTEGKLLVSNPCFEVWFLAHLRYTTRRFRSSQDVINELAKELGGYEKGDPSIYDKLKDKISDAVKNAKRMEESCRKDGYTYHKHDFSPCTDVYKAIIGIKSP